MEELLRMSAGNPGAVVCLIQLLDVNANEPVTSLKNLQTFRKLKELNIKGTDIYVLWSDLCNKDNALMHYLSQNVPADLLIDACSRQDYSGRDLIVKYVKDYEQTKVQL